jgi:hypothetical protein
MATYVSSQNNTTKLTINGREYKFPLDIKNTHQVVQITTSASPIPFWVRLDQLLYILDWSPNQEYKRFQILPGFVNCPRLCRYCNECRNGNRCKLPHLILPLEEGTYYTAMDVPTGVPMESPITAYSNAARASPVDPILGQVKVKCEQTKLRKVKAPKQGIVVYVGDKKYIQYGTPKENDAEFSLDGKDRRFAILGSNAAFIPDEPVPEIKSVQKITQPRVKKTFEWTDEPIPAEPIPATVADDFVTIMANTAIALKIAITLSKAAYKKGSDERKEKLMEILETAIASQTDAYRDKTIDAASVALTLAQDAAEEMTMI